MNFDPGIVEIVLGMTLLANGLVEALFTPIFEELNLAKKWLMYVAWIVAGVFVWLTGANLFVGVIQSAVAGQIITAIIAGRGANLLHDLSDKEDSMAFLEKRVM